MNPMQAAPTAFSTLLKQKIGLDPEAIGMAAIERAVRHRAQARSDGDQDAYWRLLTGSADEQQQLIEAVVVPETSFFRHAESMDALALLARQRRAAAHTLRVLSLPCSSGEEPYTIAMALLDAGIDGARFSVLGVDISERLVAHARQGIYGRNSFRGDALTYRNRHFSATEQGYAVTPRIRAPVVFRTGNLLDPGLALPEAEYDFVFCRNLLIYFDSATQETAVGVLRRLARPDGVIFVGPAEASLLTRLGLRQIDAPRAFAFRRASEADAGKQADVARPSRTRPIPSSSIKRTGSTTAGTTRAAPRTMAKTSRQTACGPTTAESGQATHTDAAARPTDAASQDPAIAHGAAQSLTAVQALADEGRIQDALAAGVRHLTVHGASASAYYLIGLLHDAAGAPAQAEAAYRKALYLAPGHRETLLHLASLVEARGDGAGARQLRQRAARHGDGHA
jgi:chemotaxis protein methyltransferase WspC